MADRLVEPVFKQGGFVRQSQRRGIARQGRRGRARQSAWDKVKATLRRRTWRCEACDVHHLRECSGRYEHTHHVLPKGRGGRDVIGNALPVSFAHHDWIHQNTTAAEKLGLLDKTTAEGPA